MQESLIGEIASLGAALSWAIGVCIYRAWGDNIPSFTLNLLKNFVAIVLLGLTLAVLRPDWPTDRQALAQLALSGIVGVALGDSASLAALRRLGAQVSTIGLCLGPPVATVAAFFMMGETLDNWEILGVTVTLAGVLGSVYHGSRGGGREVGLGVVFLVISGLCQGLGSVLGRQGMQAVEPFTGTLVRLIAANVALIGYLAVGRRGDLRNHFTGKKQFLALAGGATIGTYLGLILMSIGLKYTKAGVGTAIMSTFPIWVIPIAVYFLGEKTDRRRVAFTVLAAAGVVILVLK